MVIKLILYLILTVSGLMLLKLGSSVNGVNIMFGKINTNISFISLIGIMFYIMSFLVRLNILKYNELSFIFPIVNGLVTVMIVLGGVIILHEKVVPMQWVGIMCIVFGVFVINFSK